VRAAVARLGVDWPVAVDLHHGVWEWYGNVGWPARYLWDQRGALSYYHYGEGAYDETELAIQELLGVQREPLAPFRPEDEPDAQLPAQTTDQQGAYSGAYEAGGVWLVLDGRGTIRAEGAAGATAQIAVGAPGAYLLFEHARHSAGTLLVDMEAGVECLATCFTPGIA
jgi:hypothetical protein